MCFFICIYTGTSNFTQEINQNITKIQSNSMFVSFWFSFYIAPFSFFLGDKEVGEAQGQPERSPTAAQHLSRGPRREKCKSFESVFVFMYILLHVVLCLQFVLKD